MLNGAVKGAVEGLKGQPWMLTIVVLNLIAMGVAYLFLTKLVEISSERTDKIVHLLEECLRGARQ